MTDENQEVVEEVVAEELEPTPGNEEPQVEALEETEAPAERVLKGVSGS